MARKRVTDNPVVVSTGAGAAPARRKAATTKRTTSKAVEASPIVETPVVDTETKPVVAAAQVTHEEIARLAYLFWEERGCQGGSPEEDWLRAEQQLTATFAK